MDTEDRLREGLSDLAAGAGWTDLEGRVLRASNRLAWRRRVVTTVSAVAVLAAVAVPIALTGPDRSDRRGPVAGPPPSSSPSASASPSQSVSSSPPESAPSSPSSGSTGTSEPPAETGCPVSAKTLFAALSGAYLGGTDIGRPTGVSNVVCYGRYATAKPVPAVGSIRILFGYELPERKWVALNAGTRGMCDSYVLDGSISARLPGC